MSYCPTFLVRLEPPFCRFVNVVYPTAQTPILQEGLPIDAFSDERSHTLWKQKDKTLSDNDVAAFYSANGSAASGSHAMEKPVLETSLASSTLQQDPETHRIRGKRQGVNKNVTSEQDSAPILRLKCDDEFCQGNSFSCCLHNSHPSTNNEFELILNTGVAGSLLNQASSGMDGSLCEGDLNGERFPTHGCLRSDTNGRLTPTVRGQKVVDLNQQDTSSKTAERLANPFSYKLRSSIDSDRPGMNKREGDYVCFALVGLDREVASETRQPEESERICDELRDAQDCCTGPGVLACVVTCAATGGSAVRVCYANHSPSSVVLPIRNLGSQVEVPQLENMQETPEPALPSKTVSQPGIAKLGSENAAAKDVSKSENVTSEIDPLESTDLDVEDTVNKSLILANKCDDVEDKLDVYTVEEDIIIRKSGDKNNNRLPAFSLQKLSSCDETVSDLETSYGGAKEQLSRYNKPLSNVIPKINERAVNNNSSFDERGEPSSDSDGEANFDDRNSADHRQPIRVNGIHDAPVNNENIRIVQEEVYIDVFHASTSGDDSCSDDDDDDDDSDADSDSRDEKYSENVGDIFKNNASSVAAVASREEPEIAVENDYLHALKPQASLDTMYAYENFLNFHNMKEVVNLKEEVVFDIGSQANGSSCVELHHAEKRKEQFKVNPLNGVASNNTQSSKSCLESLSETCEKSRDLEASDLPECSPACFATFVGRTTEEGHGYTNMEENLQDNKGVADDISRRKGFYEGKSKEENNENELDTCNEVKSEVSEKLHGHALEHPESSFPFRLMPDQKTKPTSKPRAGSRSWMGNAAFLDWDDIVESRDTREHRTISPDAIMSSRTADDLDKNCVSNTFEQEGIKYVVSDHEKNAALSNSSVDIGLKYRREEEPMETLWSESAEENPTEKLSERIFNDHESLLRLKAVRDQNVDTETSDETVPSFQNENDSRCDLSDSSDIDAFPPTASPLAANKAETQISAHAPVLEVRLSNNNPETQVEGALISIDERQGQCLLEEESLALSLEPACVIIDGHLENHCSVTAIEGEVARGSRVTTPEESTPERQYLCEDALMMKRSIVTSPDIVRGTKDVNANAADQETGVDGAIVVDTTVSKAADAVAMGSAAVSPVNEGRGQSEALDGGLERGQRLEETKDNRPLGTSTCQGKEMTHWQLAPYSETVEETSLVVLKPGSPDGISCELDLEADTVLQAGDLRQESSDTVEQALALQLERSSSTANPGETVVSSAAEVCFPHEEETECPIAEQAVKESQTLQSYVVEDLCFIDVDQNSQFADGISNTAPDTASSYLVEAAEIPDETSTAFDDLVEVKSEVHALFLGNRDGLAFSVTEDQEPDSDENECDKVVAKSYLSMTGQMKVEEESAVDEVVCTYEECSVPSDCSRSEWNSNGRESPDGTATAPLSPVSDTTTSHTEWNSNFKRFIEEHAFAENDSLHRERSVLRSVINGTVDKGSQADGDASEKHGNFDGNNETFPLTMELSEENMDLTEDSLDGISCESATPPPFDCEQDIPPERHKKPSVVLGGAKDDVIRYPMRLPTKTVLDFCCDKGCQADLILEMESKGNQTISILDFYCDKECQTKEASEVGFLQNESQVRTVQSQTELLIDQSCQVERLHEPSDSQETLDYLESDLYTDLEEVIHLLPGKIKIENANGTMPGNFVRPRQVESSLDDHVHHKECPDCPVATAQEFQVVQSDFTEPASPRINPTADVGTQKNVSHENKQCQTSPDIEQYLKRSEQRETPPLSEFQDYDSDGSQSTGKTVQNLSSPVLSPQMMDPCVTQRPRPYGQSPGPNDRFPFEFLSSRSPSFTERVASARVDKSSQALLCNCGNTCDGAKIECSFADASNPSYSGAAMRVSEGMQKEQESLIKQLDMLRDMNQKLRDDKDAIEAAHEAMLMAKKERGHSLSDEIEEAEKKTKVSRQGSKLSKYVKKKRSQNPADTWGHQGSMESSSGFSGEEVDAGASDDKSDARRPKRRSRYRNMKKQGSVMYSYYASNSQSSSLHDSIREEAEFDGDPTLELLPDEKVEELERPAWAKKIMGFVQPKEDTENKEEESEEELEEDVFRRRKANLISGHDLSEDDDSDVSLSDDMSDESGSDLGDRPSSPRAAPVGKDNDRSRTASQDFSEAGVSAISESSAAPERVFKVVFVGDSGVGKSSFIHRFCHDTWKASFTATIGVDFQIKTMFLDGRCIALQLWDTAGQERFRSITKQYFRKADGVIVFYDVTMETSFLNIKNWMISVEEGTDDGTAVMIVGNKIDLIQDDSDRAVRPQDGQRLAEDFKALYAETSAKTGHNIHECMVQFSKMLQVREDELMQSVLNLVTEEPKKKKCCK